MYMYMCVWAAFEYYKCRNESSRDSVVILNVTHHLTKSSVTSCTNGKVFDANNDVYECDGRGNSVQLQRIGH